MLSEVYKFEVSQILTVQNSLYNYETFLEFVSTFAHPKFFLIYVIPFLAAINTNIYFDVVFAAIATEYINILMKWIVSEDRPYWWVQETKSYTAINRPKIYQTKMSCETTSGFPSGHSMFVATVFYILFIHVVQKLVEKYPNWSKIIKSIIWSIYGIILVSMTISRMYFGCHFFHQCIGGIIFGIIVAELSNRPSFKQAIKSMSKKKALMYATLLTLVVFGFYWFLKAFGIDPQWSIHMAFKFCSNPTFVSPDSTPMYGFSRDVGVGAAIALAAPLMHRLETKINWMLSVPTITFLVILHGLLLQYTPKYYGFIIFYTYSCLLYLCFTFAYLWMIPKFCKLKIKSS